VKVLRLPRSKVKLGAPLPWGVRDEAGILLLSKGHILTTEHQLELLLARGAFVDVEEIRASAREEQATQAPTATVAPNLFGEWELTPQALKTLLTHTDVPEDFALRLDAFAAHILKLVDSSPDIAIYRSVRQDNAQSFYYGYAHALHTAVLCVLMARHLHWPPQRVQSLLKAALTMNLSIMDLQGQMAGQDVPMRERQQAEIHNHPEDAAATLQKWGITDTDWLQAVAQHHEHPDGTGYPQGCTDMGEMALALRVCDVFIAKISPRVLRPAMAPQEAVRQLYREDHGGPLSTAIIKEFGIYPPGDFVTLASGELGVVVQRTENARAPIVASITDTAGHPVARTLRHDTSQAEFAIVGAASHPAMLARLPPERLYGFAKVQTD
jgi:HD-GYP domain-containing protein (c-di-GMP phosphodiesterase class II)